MRTALEDFLRRTPLGGWDYTLGMKNVIMVADISDVLKSVRGHALRDARDAERDCVGQPDGARHGRNLEPLSCRSGELMQYAHDMDSTLEALGEEFGVTRERVRQIEEVALEKVRIGIEIDERLGRIAATPVLELSRGAPLRRFKRALRLIEELSARERMVQAVGRRVLEELEAIR